MNKQRICVLLSSALLTTAASTAFADNNNFCGFYTGAAVGLSSMNGRVNSTTSETISTVTGATTVAVENNFLNQSTGLRKNSAIGSLYVGYGNAWDCFYLGGEVFVDWSKRRATNSLFGTDLRTTLAGTFTGATFSDVTQVRLRSTDWGFDLRPGWLLSCDSMVYLRVGVASNHLTVSSINSGSFFSSTPAGFVAVGPAFANVSGKKHRGALRLGIGFEQRICECLTARLDYVHTNYGRVNVTQTTTTTIPVAGATFAAVSATNAKNVRVNTNAIKLGLNWYW